MENLFIFFVGSCCGSFLNQLAYQNKLDWSWERSHCNNCHHQLNCRQTIPIYSFLRYLGKCPWCHTSISPLYLISELLAGLLLVIFTKTSLINQPISVILISFSFLFSLMDLYHLKINPNYFYLMNVLCFILLGNNHGLLTLILQQFVPTLLFSLTLLLLTTVFPATIGGADLKILLSWSFYLGMERIALIIAMSCLTALLFNLKHSTTKPIPFIPYLTGALIAVCLYK